MARRHRIRKVRRTRLASDRGNTTLATKNKKNTNEVSGPAITNAIATFLPLLRALVLEAEASGKSGPEKHAAVSQAAEQLYRLGQGQIKELRYVPWALIAPFVVPATGGVISIVVDLFNKLWGKVWAFISKYVGDDDDG